MAKTFHSRLFGYRKQEVDLAVWEQTQRQTALEEENKSLSAQVEALTCQVEMLQTKLTVAQNDNRDLHTQMDAFLSEQEIRLQENEARLEAALQEAERQKQAILRTAEERVKDLFEALDRSGKDSRERFDAAMAMLATATAPLRENAHTVENALTEIRTAALSLPAAYNRLQDARATAQADLETAFACFHAADGAPSPALSEADKTETAAVFFET